MSYLYFRAQGADMHRGTNSFNLQGNPIGWEALALSETSGSDNGTRTMTTLAGPVTGLEVGSGSARAEWISPPLAADVTISGAINAELYGYESSMSANAAINFVVDVIRGSDMSIQEIVRSSRTTELGTSVTLQAFSATPSSGVTCHKGDRIRVRIFMDDAGTMANGYTATFQFGGSSTYQSDISFTETLTFAGQPTQTSLYLTAISSDLSPPGIAARKASFSNEGAGASYVRNTTAGWTAPLQWTAGQGGDPLEWYSPQLEAVTLGGKAYLQIYAKESAASTYASLGIEIAVCDSDGSNPVVWATVLKEAGSNYGELPTSEVAANAYPSADDISIAQGQRLRIRLLLDDVSNTGLASSRSATIWTNGTSYLAFVTFPQALVEHASGPRTVPISLDASLSLSSVMSRQTSYKKTLAASVTPTLAVQRGLPRALSASEVLGLSISRGRFQALPRTLVATAAMALAKAKGISLPASLVGELSLGRITGKTMPVTMTEALAMSRVTGKPLPLALTVTPAMTRKQSYFRTLAAGLTLGGALSFGKLKLMSLSAGLTLASAMSRVKQMTMPASLSPSNVLGKQATHKLSLAATLTPAPTMNRGLLRSLPGSLTLAGAIALAKFKGITLNALMSLVPGSVTITNVIPNSSVNTNLTNWFAYGSILPTIVRDTANARPGSKSVASARVDTNNGAVQQGIEVRTGAASIPGHNQRYAIGVWVKCPAGRGYTVVLYEENDSGGAYANELKSITGNDDWQYITFARTLQNYNTTQIGILLRNNVARTGESFWMTDAQIELAVHGSPHSVFTDGASASDTFLDVQPVHLRELALTLTPAPVMILARSLTRVLAAGLSLGASLMRQRPVTLANTSTLTPQLSFQRGQRTIPLSLDASLVLAPVSNFVRKRFISLAGGITMTAAIVRLPLKVLALTVTMGVALNRKLWKTLTGITLTLSPSLVPFKSKFISLAASLTPTNVMSLRRTRVYTLVASLVPTPALVRKLYKAMPTSLSTSPTLNRGLKRTLANTATLSPALARQLGRSRTLAAGLTLTTALARRTTLAKQLDASLTLTGAVSRVVGRKMAVDTPLSAQLARGMFKRLTAGVVMQPGLTRTNIRRLAAIAVLDVTEEYLRQANISLPASLNPILTLQAAFQGVRNYADIMFAAGVAAARVLSAAEEMPIIEDVVDDKPKIEGVTSG